MEQELGKGIEMAPSLKNAVNKAKISKGIRKATANRKLHALWAVLTEVEEMRSEQVTINETEALKTRLAGAKAVMEKYEEAVESLFQIKGKAEDVDVDEERKEMADILDTHDD